MNQTTVGFVHYIAYHKNLPLSLVCQRFVLHNEQLCFIISNMFQPVEIPPRHQEPVFDKTYLYD